MEARAEAQRVQSDRRRALAQAASAAALVSALASERESVDAIRTRMQDPEARAVLAPEAALDLELALLEHREAEVVAIAQCEAATWEQIRLGLSLDQAATIPIPTER